MSFPRSATSAAVGLLLVATAASAAVPAASAKILTIGRSAEGWAVRPIRGEGWNIPIEGSVVIRPPYFVRRAA